jgi:UPF0755 protein
VTKTHGLLLLLIVGACIGASLLAYFNSVQSSRPRPRDITQFEIREGESSSIIVNHLKDAGLIHYPTLVLVYARTHRVVFLPGMYAIPDSYSDSSLLQIFSSKQSQVRKLTIPEGYSREQIAGELKNISLSDVMFLKLTKSREGMLFPDTYNIDDKTTEETLVMRMIDQYHRKTDSLLVSVNDLILASIVEREAKKDSDRPLIAGIYKNRLKNGMALEADPTVQYAKYTDLGQAPIKDGKTNYWAPITKADYTDVLSPYNTYVHTGLPPTPICNPGLASIMGVKNSTQTDTLYFFHTSDGRMITSRTLEEHNANKAKYLR